MFKLFWLLASAFLTLKASIYMVLFLTNQLEGEIQHVIVSVIVTLFLAYGTYLFYDDYRNE